jgi:tRNA modification GTPase
MFEFEVLTPAGRGAVAVIAVDGTGAAAAIARHFVPAGQHDVNHLAVNRIVFGRWLRDESHAGEELVVCHTADDLYEVHCHGGAAAVEAIVVDLSQIGGVSGSGLTRTDANDPLIPPLDILAEARTERTAAILLDQCRGALRREYDTIVEQGLPREPLEKLFARQQLGEHLTKPFRVVLAGPPNAGKSSLINALLGYDRAIVFDQPGTTRDVLSAVTAFDGWLVELSDTAGLRETADPLEAAGVARTTRQLDQADLILWVHDLSSNLIADPPPPQPGIAFLSVFNKCDLLPDEFRSRVTPGLAVSALTGFGLKELQANIVQTLVPDPPLPGEGMPVNEEQVEILKRLVSS